MELGTWNFNLLTFGVFLLALSLAAQTSNAPAPSRLDYANFQVIYQRNIFNPNRTARYVAQRREFTPGRSVEYFALVGTMLYQKGEFAFFEGSSHDYKQVLEPGGTIAGYKVTGILPRSVKLEANGKELEMKVGAQMRREEGRWQLLGPTEWTPPSAEAAAASSTDAAPAAGDDPGMEMNAILKKLMEQKEKELK